MRGRNRLSPHDIVMNNIRALHLLSSHPRPFHQRLSQSRVCARQRRRLRQLHVKLALGRRRSHLNQRFSFSSIFIPQSPKFLVRLISLIHQRICIIQRRSLQHPLQHRHVFNDMLVFNRRPRAGAQRCWSTRFIQLFSSRLNSRIARRIQFTKPRMGNVRPRHWSYSQSVVDQVGRRRQFIITRRRSRS